MLQAVELPAELKPLVIGVLQRDAGPEYQVRAEGAEHRAHNPAQGWEVRYLGERVEVVPEGPTPAWGLSMRLNAMEADGRALVGAVTGCRVEGNRYTYIRGWLEEWYVNGPLGLEKGFTVTAPLGPRVQCLTLALALGPGWKAEVSGVGLKLMQGEKTLYYGALQACDAAGRVLPATLAAAEGGIEVQVAVAGALYPVTIDPLLTEEAKLTASDPVQFGRFGRSVALSASGKIALVGAPGANCIAGNACGAAYVFVREGGRWVERQKLTASDAAPHENFGIAVALSASGKTALVGANEDDCLAGDDCGAAVGSSGRSSPRAMATLRIFSVVGWP
jgi:hypothetical protein